MKTFLLLVLGFVLSCGRAPDSSPLRFRLEIAGATISDGRSRIEMRATETLMVALLVVGAVQESVNFTSANLPHFATLNGAILKLAPEPTDAGEYMVTLTATAAGSSQSTLLSLVVQRENHPPWLGYSLPAGGIRFIDLSDETGVRGLMCPGTSCVVQGTPKLLMTACDDDGDAVTVDVEIIPEGQSFSKIPTFTVTSSGPWDFATCRYVSVALSGLSPKQVYDFAVRVTDQLGATAGKVADGWLSTVEYPSWQFEQGP